MSLPKPTWDNFIDKVGKNITIHRLSAIVLDDYNNIDLANSTWTQTSGKMFIGARRSDKPQLNDAPEGTDVSEYMVVFMRSSDVADIRDGVDGDIVEWNGKFYRVVRIDKDDVLIDRATLNKVFLQELPEGNPFT